MPVNEFHLSYPRTMRALLVLGLVGVLSAGCGPTSEAEMRVRKNAKYLSSQEKKDLVDAILALKSAPPPMGIQEIVIGDGAPPIPISNYYDMFVAIHQAAVVAHAHGGPDAAHHNPSFPPWHRKLLLMYENALREVSGKDITLPYWDWTDDESRRAVFSVDLMGPEGDENCKPDCPVLEGSFRKGAWELTLQTRIEKYKPMHPGTWLVRGTGNYDGLPYDVALPTARDIQTAMTINAYDAPPYDMNVDRMKSFRNYLEGFEGETEPPTQQQHMHNIVHDWVAGQWKVLSPKGEVVIRVGTMEPLDISPSDPVFFLHHANVDRVWAQWQKHADGRMSAYVPESSAQHGWGPQDKMYPFSLFEGMPVVGSNITPESMLNFELLSYTYDDMVD